MLLRLADTPDLNADVTVSVQTSKHGDCAAGETVAVGVQDLQEMYNQFSQQVDKGLYELASDSGKNGLPPSPNSSTTAGSVPAPAPDSDAVAQLGDAQQRANQVAGEVQQASALH